MRFLSVSLLAVLSCCIVLCGCTAPSLPSPTQNPAALSPVAVHTTAGPAANGMVKEVKIIQRSFDPDIVTISPGTTVTWINEDSVNHRVVHLPDPLDPTEKELFRSGLLSPGDSFSYTFFQAGEYGYGDPQYGSGRHSLVIVT